MAQKFLEKFALYWHTMRHLRPVQIYGRVWFRIYRPKPDPAPPPAPRKTNAEWKMSITRPATMHGANEFVFLNKQGKIGHSNDWNSNVQTKLWLYNLHYFDDLNAVDADARNEWHQTLIARWIEENPPAKGNGWEPYPLSLRIVNWIKWALAGNALSPEVLHSLAIQIRYLRQRLEWHLLGNHLFANAKALVFAGLFFEGREAEAWLDKGLCILEREIPEQMLPDGGHFELSPMYHSILLEDMLDLINVSSLYGHSKTLAIENSWRETAQRMLDWLAVMCHPDGRISFFNDTTFDIATEPELINAYAKRLGMPAGTSPGEGITNLKDSGYIRVQSGELVMLIDVAHIGPDYIPGHAHADTLSFELSYNGQRVFVNSGISQYGRDTERLYQRSTSAHNTVEVDGENSSEIWSGFRVARRARPFDLVITETPESVQIACSHDGYHRLKGQVTHRREWIINKDSVEVHDDITGSCERAVCFYFLHPDIHPKMEADSGYLEMQNGTKIHCEIVGGESVIKKTNWHPGFGISFANNCLMIKHIAPKSRMKLSW